MDTRVPADEGGWPSPSTAGGDAGSIDERLAAIERRLDTLEVTVRETVTEELHTAGDELRRAVSDLGRLLLRDLDRLTKVLAEHRDAIVDRVTTAVAAEVEAAPVSAPSVASNAAPDGDEAEAAGDGDGVDSEGRWRRKARRAPKGGTSDAGSE